MPRNRNKGTRNHTRRRSITTNLERLREQKSDLYRKESVPVSQHQSAPDHQSKGPGWDYEAYLSPGEQDPPKKRDGVIKPVGGISFEGDESYLGEETVRKLREKEFGTNEQPPDGAPDSENEPDPRGWADATPLGRSGEWFNKLEPRDKHVLDSPGSPERE